ncbi:hypothetical protein [Agriterribacter sp.]|uniref:hypothetical protein n=1 Tax=Agriterribacter sp. TaxID=2821509 RepID=UPI002C06BD7C|nr:hypothetical protein [Agriterribacter sp.]HRP55068.1 hypothetical protein [Agriterribacter sp.]
MKYLLLSFIFFIALGNAFAQINKGVWMVGGNGTFLSSKIKFENSTYAAGSDRVSVSVSAPIGYFFVDKFAAGLKPAYDKFKEESTGGGYSNENRYGLGPFARYYFLNKDNQFNILTDLGYQYGLYRFKPRRGHINTFFAGAGLTGFFNTSVGIEILAGYYFRKEIVKESYTTTQKGFQMSIGFQFYLEK